MAGKLLPDDLWDNIAGRFRLHARSLSGEDGRGHRQARSR